MSYNIDTWKIQRLENLRIPLEAFYLNPRRDWHPDRENEDDGSLTLRCGEGGLVHGRLHGTILHVDKITLWGECSGNLMEEVFEPALKQSKGRLTARLVWEGGDSISRLSVVDGKVTQKELDP